MRVLEAMRNVPRHWFVPKSQADHAHFDRPLPIGFNQTISQPYIVALMTEQLELKPTSKVLEIGTGSGYQAAVLAEIVGEVYTIEIIEALAETARERLHRLARCDHRLRNPLFGNPSWAFVVAEPAFTDRNVGKGNEQRQRRDGDENFLDHRLVSFIVTSGKLHSYQFPPQCCYLW